MTTKTEVSIAIRPQDGSAYDRPVRTVAEPLPDLCPQHGHSTQTRHPVRVGFARELDFRQITFARVLWGSSSATRFFRNPPADAIVIAHWPRCSRCLGRILLARAIGWILAVAAAVPITLFLATAVTAVATSRMPAIIGDISGVNMLTQILVPWVFPFGLLLIRGAFSFSRPILRARLNDEQTALLVTVHPEFATALKQLRKQPPPTVAPTLW